MWPPRPDRRSDQVEDGAGVVAHALVAVTGIAGGHPQSSATRRARRGRPVSRALRPRPRWSPEGRARADHARAHAHDDQLGIGHVTGQGESRRHGHGLEVATEGVTGRHGAATTSRSTQHGDEVRRAIGRAAPSVIT